MVIARLHNISHMFNKSQLAIDGNSKYVNWLWTRHDGVSKMYRSNRRGGIFKFYDLLPCVCDQCLGVWWVEQQIVIKVPSGDCICPVWQGVDVIVRWQINGCIQLCVFTQLLYDDISLYHCLQWADRSFVGVSLPVILNITLLVINGNNESTSNRTSSSGLKLVQLASLRSALVMTYNVRLHQQSQYLRVLINEYSITLNIALH